MKEISFTDENETKLKTFINNAGFAVFSLTQHDDFLVYVFDDENEIDEFIEELKKVKEILINL